MPFNAKQFCIDYRIRYYTSGKNVASGWISIQCPLCDDRSNHGGFSKTGSYSCWNCGKHSLYKVISKLIKADYQSIKNIISNYSNHNIDLDDKPKKDHERPTTVKFPPDTTILSEQAKNYLTSRNFDPDKLTDEWSLLSTGYIGYLKHRIIAPIHFKHQIVSYQARDFTGKQTRYLPCPKEHEIIPYKSILYGIDKVKHKRCIIVEGITDVWRLGPGALALFGKDYTRKQIKLSSQLFDIFFIFLDPEYEAQRKANEISYYLRELGKDVEILTSDDGDVGDMSEEEAKYLMRDLGF